MRSQQFDVPFVPTPQVVVDEMLRLANVGPGDFVIDLGSGDGRIPIAAAKKFGARALGVDLDFHLIIQSEESARQAAVEDRVKFMQQDLFKTDLGPATVITMYLLPAVNRRLRPQLLDLKPGTRIVAHDFDLDDWKPDRKVTIRKNVFLWIVPAKVAGRWRMRLALPGSARSNWNCGSASRKSTAWRGPRARSWRRCGNRGSGATRSVSSWSTVRTATTKRVSILKAG